MSDARRGREVAEGQGQQAARLRGVLGEGGAEAKIKGVIIGKYRGDEGDCLLLLRRYYHRTADDATGLTFMRWEAKKGEVLVVNSTELCAVQGQAACDFQLHPICLHCKPGAPCGRCKEGKPAPQLSAKAKEHAARASESRPRAARRATQSSTRS